MRTDSVNHWADDLLNRKQDAEFIYNFLVGQNEKIKMQGHTKSYVLNLDAEWGGGKSFFLERFAKDLKAKGHIVVEINAWRSDYAEDPYVAIMAAFEGAFRPFVKKDGAVQKAWKATKAKGGPIALLTASAVGKGLVRKALGFELGEVMEAVANQTAVSDAINDGVSAGGDQIEKLFDSSMEKIIAGFRRAESSSENFQRNLEATIRAATDNGRKALFVLIDELDRCRPSYAVSLLERVKHLFSVQGIIFVFGTNTSQLGHCVAGAYGSSFDGHNYLNRFFDRAYTFMPPPLKSFIESEISRIQLRKLRVPENRYADVITSGITEYKLDLRSTKVVLELMDAVLSAWRHDSQVEIALLLPLCVGYFSGRTPEWPEAQSIPNSWRFKESRKTVNFEGREIERTIVFRDVYQQATGMMHDLNIAISASNNSTGSATAEYASYTFVPEWTRKSIQGKTASVQVELLGLVVNAGRLTAPSGADIS